MFVRWQKKGRVRTGKASSLMSAVLVECHRVAGKPSQKVIAYLGGIREARINVSERYHRQFWRSVDDHLDALQLDPDIRKRIEASIESKVRRVTSKIQAEFDETVARRKCRAIVEMASL